MRMHRTKSGRLLSHDSVVAFLEENSWDRNVYDIKNQHLVYRDSSKRLRSIDLDLIPSIDGQRSSSLLPLSVGGGVK